MKRLEDGDQGHHQDEAQAGRPDRKSRPPQSGGDPVHVVTSAAPIEHSSVDYRFPRGSPTVRRSCAFPSEASSPRNAPRLPQIPTSAPHRVPVMPASMGAQTLLPYDREDSSAVRDGIHREARSSGSAPNVLDTYTAMSSLASPATTSTSVWVRSGSNRLPAHSRTSDNAASTERGAR